MDVHAVEKTLMNFVEFDKVPGKKGVRRESSMLKITAIQCESARRIY